jgi:hypothetical protein
MQLGADWCMSSMHETAVKLGPVWIIEIERQRGISSG